MFNEVNLHSNMFLLRLSADSIEDMGVVKFTFQYVSIKTALPMNCILKVKVFTFQYVSIKTTVFVSGIEKVEVIYIPICFY